MMRINTKSYKHLTKPRTVFYGFMAVLFMVLCLSTPSFAASVTIDDIEVDVTATNAVEARAKAFEEAQVKGYAMLAEKMLSDEDLKTFEVPEYKTVSRYVRDYEVTNEKLSATRYAGVFKIRYDSSGFSSMPKSTQASGSGESAVVAPKATILVLPFFEDAGYPMLWRTNPFMQAWLRARDNGRAAPAIVPRGDTQDITMIKDNDALRYDPNNLLQMKRRYKAPHAAILLATPELMPDGRQNLAVAIYQAKSYGPELAQQISIRSEVRETSKSFYDRTVAEVNQVFKNKWKRKTAVKQPSQASLEQPLTGPVNTLIAQVGFNTMRQWVDTKKSIERARGVRGLGVNSLSSRGATLSISYQGGVENLRASLRANGVGLNDPLTQSNATQSEGSFIYKLSPVYGAQ